MLFFKSDHSSSQKRHRESGISNYTQLGLDFHTDSIPMNRDGISKSTILGTEKLILIEYNYGRLIWKNNDENDEEAIMFSERLVSKLKEAKTVAVLTGAGISAESGVPTFRGEEGLWKKFRPEELANVDAFMRNPGLVWEWYNYRKKIISEVQPNPAHYALVAMEKYFQNFYLITQNVDNLHRRAGSQKIYELHGNIMRNRCVDCNKRIDEVTVANTEDLPRCDCGGLVRPDVVWFGEALPQQELRDSFQAASNSDVFFSIGTSAVIQPAASLPVEAKYAHAYVVEINTELTVISNVVDETLLGKAGQILPLIVEKLLGT